MRGDHLVAAGRYAAQKQPDVIALAGDMGDFPSCSYYDQEKGDFGQRSYQEDLDALEHGLQLFLEQIMKGPKNWNPYIFVTLGNHEDRVDRVLADAPQAKWRHAVRTPTDLYRDYGIEVFPFLSPVIVDGVAYCHYFPNPMTGKPQTGMMQTMLKNIGFSFTMGHRQILDTGNRTLANGQVHRGLIAGAFYLHNEDYRSGPANLHWRGIVQKNEMDGFGDYSLMDINLSFLLREYGPTKAVHIDKPDRNWTGMDSTWRPTK